MKYLITLFFTLPLALGAQCVTGTIVDAENGNPLIGVYIHYQQTTKGTVTDFDGKFSLCAGQTDSLDLLITYTGYENKRLRVGPKQQVGEILLQAGVTLEEVVVQSFHVPMVEMDRTSSGMVVTAAAMRSLGPRNSGKSRRGRKRTNEREPINTESYNKIKRNGFTKTKDQKFSTISTDVDRAAYANVRRFLNEGKLPPPDAVRTEELINYFRYEDPAPTSRDAIALRREYLTCPWNKKHQLLRVSAKTMPLAAADVPASNLVFLLDVSGSMRSHNKLPLVKKSLKLLTQQMRPQDKVAIVVYAGAAGLVLPSTSGKDPGAILAALDKLQAGGSTAGGAGIRLAYETARKNFILEGNNRIILATDGDFNVGLSSQEALVKLIEKERESGIYLTVLGFGSGNYQEGTMQELADRGNGNHGYIDSEAEAQKMLVSEFGGTMFTVAKDVKLQLEFDPKYIASYRLIGYENRLLAKEDFDDDTKDAAEMGAGHNVTVLYELVPTRKYQDANYVGSLRLRYKRNTGGPSKKESYPISANHLTDDVASNDIRWAATVAEFAMLLTDSKHKGKLTWAQCLEHAKAAQGTDTEGYRAEMIELVEKAMKLERGK
ncbi:MAG: von Willebrand factor type A domain-containing protein [Bacteroidota bacterium]